MTAILKTLFVERAHELEPYQPDLAAIVATGKSRRRRRRAARTIAGVAALGVIAALPATISALKSDDRAGVAATGPADLAWSQGTRIHVGDKTVDVGREVRAFVHTRSGFVFTDPESAVWSWTDGRAIRVGAMSDDWRQRLVAHGDHAAWLDVSDEAWRFAILDQRTGDVLTTPAQIPGGATDSAQEPGATAANLLDRTNTYAIDSGMVYAADARGVIAIDLSTGSPREVAAPADVQLHDVEGGQILFSRGTGGPRGDNRTYLGADTATATNPLGVKGGDISPGASWVMSENSATRSDDFTLIDTQSGTALAPDAKNQFDFFTGYGWVDGDTYWAYGIRFDRGRASASVALMTCEAPTGECTTRQDGLPLGGFQLPTGEHLSS